MVSDYVEVDKEFRLDGSLNRPFWYQNVDSNVDILYFEVKIFLGPEAKEFRRVNF